MNSLRPSTSVRAFALASLLAIALLVPLLTLVPRAAAQGAGAVRINEFVAANQTGLADNTGEVEDWVELHNTSGATANLDGWTLTAGDDVFSLTGQSIPANGFLIVFASGATCAIQAQRKWRGLGLA